MRYTYLHRHVACLFVQLDCLHVRQLALQISGQLEFDACFLCIRGRKGRDSINLTYYCTTWPFDESHIKVEVPRLQFLLLCCCGCCCCYSFEISSSTLEQAHADMHCMCMLSCACACAADASVKRERKLQEFYRSYLSDLKYTTINRGRESADVI